LAAAAAAVGKLPLVKPSLLIPFEEVLDVTAVAYNGDAADRGKGLMALLVDRPDAFNDGDDVVFLDKLCTLLLL